MSSRSVTRGHSRWSHSAPSPGWASTVSRTDRAASATPVCTAVQKVLTNDYGLTGIEQVTCGDGNKVSAGTTFECRATVAGEPVAVPIRVTTDAGDYEVGRPTPA